MNLKVNIKKIFSEEAFTKAVADVVIDNSVVIHGVKIRSNNKGLYVAMPNRRYKNKDGKINYIDICHPISSAVRTAINDAVIAAYNSEVQEKLKISETEEHIC